MEDEDIEIVREFLVESHENLDLLDQALIELEQDPNNIDLLAGVFRTIHTIKGTSGALGFGKLEKVTHVGESLLGLLRDGVLKLDATRTSALLRMVDAVREMLCSIESDQTEGQGEYGPLIDQITALQSDDQPAPAPEASAAAEAAAPSPEASAAAQAAAPPPEASAAAEAAAPPPKPSSAGAPDANDASSDAAVPLAGELLRRSGVSDDALNNAFLAQQGGDKRPIGEILVSTGATTDDAVSAALSTQGDKRREAQVVHDSSVRVDVGLLDHLMNLVGELVLARNQILQFAQHGGDTAFLGTTQRLNLITTELQEGVMKTRMQPIGNIWNKFPRVVRDVAMTCNKRVQLELVGRETELDRTIIEAIKDPLTHVLRNSIDHGIEMPEVRRALNKPEAGTITMRAYHEGGHVNIEISDDGAGLDPAKLRDKAIQRGVLTAERASRMSERELANVIFLPGFSTAAQVTNVSGRGVGMDVVRTNIEKIGGSVDLHNRPGEGLTLRIKIPLTLAIIPALIIESGGERFAIPQVNLLELVRLEGEQARKAIEGINGVPLYRLRGDLLPLVYLNHQLELDPNASADDAVSIVVLVADERSFGLIVDAINDTEEIVVKPLGKELKNVPDYAGTTIMGDGQVALILDVAGLAQRAGLSGDSPQQTEVHGATEKARDSSMRSLLLFSAGGTDRRSMPLSLVSRLEEIDRSLVENVSGQHVVQYRGQIMSLVYLSELLDGRELPASTEPLQVVVYSNEGKTVGLVVERIVDIAEGSFGASGRSGEQNVCGVGVVQGHVTELLDLEAIVRAAGGPALFSADAA